MKIRFLLITVLTVISSALNLNAKSWVMLVDSPDGWTMEDGTVTIQYNYEMNPVDYNAWTGKMTCSQPDFNVKIKNNSEDFIYVDLSKTYILEFILD